MPKSANGKALAGAVIGIVAVVATLFGFSAARDNIQDSVLNQHGERISANAAECEQFAKWLERIEVKLDRVLTQTAKQ